MTTDLRRRWDLLLPGQDALGAELLSRWSEPHRHYHDRGHLAEALSALARLGSTSRPEGLALWFHDAIHTGTPGADEVASAELAASRLPEIGLSPFEIDEVVRLVLVTVHHSPDAGDLAGARVSDADLAVLGSDAARYRASVAALRAESAGLPDAEWRTLRLTRVAHLLATEPLFHTTVGRGLWQDAAAANLTAEYEILRRAI